MKRLYEEIASHFFSDAEVSSTLEIASDSRVEAFFACWKEGSFFLKAIGRGLSIPLDEFVVSTHPDEPAQLLETRFRPSEKHRWSLITVMQNSRYWAILAVEGKVDQLYRFLACPRNDLGFLEDKRSLHS